MAGGGFFARHLEVATLSQQNQSNLVIQTLEEALRACKSSFISVAVFSFLCNLLALTPIFYVINIFQKAVPAQSIPTVAALAVIAFVCYLFMALIDWVRSLVLIKIAGNLDDLLVEKLYVLCFKGAANELQVEGPSAQPLKDLHAIRQFVCGNAMTVIFDLPWIPLYFILMYVFHPALAFVALACTCLIMVIAIANQRSTTRKVKEANERAILLEQQTDRALSNAETASVMGMVPALSKRWRGSQSKVIELQIESGASNSFYASITKALNIATQSVAITTGAVLAITQQIAPGVMIGAAMLMGRCLQPIQSGVASWNTFVTVRQQYIRLNDFLACFSDTQPAKMPLPEIRGGLLFKNVTAAPPGSKKPVLTDVSANIEPGSVVAILGPSGAGKSSLLRVALGLWTTIRGVVRIDGVEAISFDKDRLGPQIGYLPQSVELFDGTVAENIARFGGVDADLVVKAATEAGVLELILALPDGFDTDLSKVMLSPGQLQRIALARALYNDPQMIFLDEPNSNLDLAGQIALNEAVLSVKRRGGTVLIVSHRRRILEIADFVMQIKDGRLVQHRTGQEFVSQQQQSHAIS